MLRSLVHHGDVLGGKYRVERVLGQGGMGLVVAGRHIASGERVAIKIMAPATAEGSTGLARFDREARAATRLRSPHVARILDAGVTSSRSPFLVMEFLDGYDLATVLRSSGPLPLAQAVALILQACQGVAAAHDQGIVHRDIKLANLFVSTSTKGEGLLKVLDFGVSKVSTESGRMSMTTTSIIIGTPLYMAPEQFSSPREVGPAADIWALGVCLYELLTGSVPFSERNIHRQYALLISKAPPRASDRRPDVPTSLDAILLRCLRRDPQERYGHARELFEALRSTFPEAELAPLSVASSTRPTQALRQTDPALETPGDRRVLPSMTESQWDLHSGVQRPKEGGMMAPIVAITSLLVASYALGWGLRSSLADNRPIVLHPAAASAPPPVSPDADADAEAPKEPAASPSVPARAPSPPGPESVSPPTADRKAAPSPKRAAPPRSPKHGAPRLRIDPSGKGNPSGHGGL